MPRFSVPTTIIATIIVDAPDAVAAMFEARRFAESLGDDTGGFRDGWNDVQRQNGAPIIADVSGFDVEGIDVADIEAMPAVWVIEPQRDQLAGEPGTETHFISCDDAQAEHWAVIERDGDLTDLVEDYPTRAAAEAAIAALEAGRPLPTPEWPEAGDADACRTDGCDGDSDNGEGFDGYCGACADRAASPD